MTYFSFYTIFNSEHYRVTVGYSSTPVQQVGTIMWNITITVGFTSHIVCATYSFVFMLKMFTSQKYRKHYPVIIFLYRARAFEPQVNLRDWPIVGTEVGVYLEIDQYSCDNFYMLRYPSHPWIKTHPLAVAWT